MCKKMNDQLASTCFSGAFTCTKSLNSCNSPMKVAMFIFILQVRKLRLTESGYHPLKPPGLAEVRAGAGTPFPAVPPPLIHHTVLVYLRLSLKAARDVLGFQKRASWGPIPAGVYRCEQGVLLGSVGNFRHAGTERIHQQFNSFCPFLSNLRRKKKKKKSFQMCLPLHQAGAVESSISL